MIVVATLFCFLAFSYATVIQEQKRDIIPPSSLPLHITKNMTIPIPKTLFGYMWEVSCTHYHATRPLMHLLGYKSFRLVNQKGLDGLFSLYF